VQALRLDAKLFGWIMDDEWVSREEIHSIARRHMPIDGLNDQLGWVLRDSSLWFDAWLPAASPDKTLHKLLPCLGDSLDQCRL